MLMLTMLSRPKRSSRNWPEAYRPDRGPVVVAATIRTSTSRTGAKTPELSVLQHVHQLGLQRHAQFTDLVEE